MPGKDKQKPKKTSVAKVPPKLKGPAVMGGDLAAVVKRLAAEIEDIKEELSKRSLVGANGGSSRRDQDKVVADRLARLDEKVEAVWNRLADLEERVEGEGAGHGHDADDFEETPEKDFYDR